MALLFRVFDESFLLGGSFVPLRRAGHDICVQHKSKQCILAKRVNKLLDCRDTTCIHVLYKSRRNSFAKEPSFAALLQNKGLFVAVVYSCIHLLTPFLSTNLLKKSKSVPHKSRLLFCKRKPVLAALVQKNIRRKWFVPWRYRFLEPAESKNLQIIFSTTTWYFWQINVQHKSSHFCSAKPKTRALFRCSFARECSFWHWSIFTLFFSPHACQMNKVNILCAVIYMHT